MFLIKTQNDERKLTFPGRHHQMVALYQSCPSQKLLVDLQLMPLCWSSSEHYLKAVSSGDTM